MGFATDGSIHEGYDGEATRRGRKAGFIAEVLQFV
jgi:hypothetical protein